MGEVLISASLDDTTKSRENLRSNRRQGRCICGVTSDWSVPVKQSIRIDRGAVAKLQTRRIAPGLPAQEWPTQPLSPVSEELLTLVASVVTKVRDESGFAVVQLTESELGDHELTQVAWNLFTLLGKPLAQYWSGELVYPVEVIDSTLGARRYSNSNRSGGFHSDGTALPDPPNVAALVCLSTADVGGETVLIDAAELCGRLDQVDSAFVHELSHEHHFDVEGQIPGHTTKLQPIVARSADDFEIRYLRREIEQGYERAGEEMPEILITAMDQIDAVASDEALQTPILLKRGEMLLWDNRRFLHGRRPFEERTSRRRLRRIFGKLA